MKSEKSKASKQDDDSTIVTKKKSETETDYLSTQPIEIKSLFLSFLELNGLNKLRRVSKAWYAFITSHQKFREFVANILRDKDISKKFSSSTKILIARDLLHSIDKQEFIKEILTNEEISKKFPTSAKILLTRTLPEDEISIVPDNINSLLTDNITDFFLSLIQNKSSLNWPTGQISFSKVSPLFEEALDLKLQGKDWKEIAEIFKQKAKYTADNNQTATHKNKTKIYYVVHDYLQQVIQKEEERAKKVKSVEEKKDYEFDNLLTAKFLNLVETKSGMKLPIQNSGMFTRYQHYNFKDLSLIYDEILDLKVKGASWQEIATKFKTEKGSEIKVYLQMSLYLQKEIDNEEKKQKNTNLSKENETLTLDLPRLKKVI